MSIAFLTQRLATIRNFLDMNVSVRDQHVHQWAKTLPAKTRVLDIGAGTIRYKHEFSHCDYLTQDHPESTMGNADIKSDILDIPLPDQSLNAILCTEVLEHVIDPAGALREFQRLLKEDGQLLLSLPSACRVHQVPTHFWGGFAPDFFNILMPQFNLIPESLTPIGNWSQYMAQEIGRFPQIVRENTAIPFRSSVSYALWPLSRVVLPTFFKLFSRYDQTTDLPLGWVCLARKKTQTGSTGNDAIK